MVFFPDTYSQPDAEDPVLPADSVLALARRHGLTVEAITRVDESGGEARAYLGDDNVVVKTQRPNRVRPRTSLAKEAFILREMASQTALPIPRLLGYGRDDDIEYLVMSRIPGVALHSISLAPSERASVLEELGKALRKLHDLDQTAMEASGLIPGDRSGADLHRRLSTVFDDLIAILASDHRWADEVNLRAVADECLAALPGDVRPVTLHSNPGPTHCFVDPDGALFTGLIDFGDAYRSHPALDLRVWASQEDRNSILAGYRAYGPLCSGFEGVWRTGLILTELRFAARSYSEPTQVVGTIKQILES